jgi:hypothetical protein
MIAVIGPLAAALVTAGVAAAAKPSSSLSLVAGSTVNAVATVQPSYGSQITFDVSTNQTDEPNVSVRCYQGTSFVYDSWGAFWTGALVGQTFTLSSNYWTSGAAVCTARLVSFDRQGRENVLASIGFNVNA